MSFRFAKAIRPRLFRDRRINHRRINHGAERSIRWALFFALSLSILETFAGICSAAKGPSLAPTQDNPARTQGNSALTQGKSATEEATQEQIDRWIQQLSDPAFIVRENAKAKLKRAGGRAFDALFRNRNARNLETRLVVRELLKRIKIHWVESTDTARIINLMAGFRELTPFQRIATIDQIAWLPTSESRDCLLRIIRFDLSPAVQDHATAVALELLYQSDEEPDAGLLAAVKKNNFLFFTSFPTTLSKNLRWCDRASAVIESMLNGLAKDSIEIGFKNLAELLLDPIPTEEPDRPIRVAVRWRMLEIAYRICKRRRLKFDTLDQIGFEMLSGDLAESERFLTTLLNHQRWEAIQRFEREFADQVFKNPLTAFLVAESKRQQKQPRFLQFAKSVLVKTKLVGANAAFGEQYLVVMELEENGLGYWAAFLLSSVIRESQGKSQFAAYQARLELHYRDAELAKRIATSLVDEGVENDVRLKGCLLLAECALKNDDRVDEFHWLQQSLRFAPSSARTLTRMYALAEGSQKGAVQQRIANAIGFLRDRHRRGIQLKNSSVPAEIDFGSRDAAESAAELGELLGGTGGNLQEALVFAEYAIGFDARNARYLSILASLKQRSGDRTEAIELLERAVRIQPHDADLRANLQKLKSGEFLP